ncbi:hypothetical protein BDZ94DRAFT_1259412 [Collybia nuda]|uniref:DUF6533 domain-containing protein n=1 Tax=Collybia nuda TaxID=64659 RepID=A0A9P6CEU0_9AGAR|nr:hypothetical protein BDZ94DRAFT_1259412 [Collybia nuda]
MLSNTTDLLEPAGDFVRKCSSIAAFSLVVWDGIVSYNQEYKYIWKNPSPVKWIYLFSRYYGICAQVANIIFITIPLSEFPVATHICTTWFASQMFSFIFHLTALQAVLILRVYALYQQSLKVAALLTSLLFLNFFLSVIFGMRAFGALNFDSVCNAREPSSDAIYFGMSTVSFHVVIWAFTIRKRDVTLQEEWRKVSVINLLTHDGTRICFGICSMLMVIIPYAFVVQVAVHVIFLWPMAMMSILTCRLVLSLRELRGEPFTRDMELVTHVDLLEAIDDE